MKEHQIEVILGIKPEPEKNVYHTNTFKQLNEINRIIKIFELKKEQNLNHQVLAIETLNSLKVMITKN